MLQLKKRIMRKIYRAFLLRSVAPFAFDCLAIIVLAFFATLFVSVRDVFLNLSTASGSGQLWRFSFSAVSETELTTKILLVVFGVAGFVAYKHLKRAVRAVRTVRKENEESSKP